MATAEFCHLMNQQKGVKINRNICVLGSVALFLSFFYYGINPVQTGIFIPYLIIIIYLMVSELYLKKENPLNNWAYAMLSQVYIALPFSLLNVLAFQSDETISTTSYQYIFPLSIFAYNWINDTGAYCTGMLFGKHPLFKRISPKKSWIGFWGGLFTAVGIAVGLKYYGLLPFDLVHCIAMSILLNVTGVYGDLIESQWKRHYNVKDSGTIIPGHGGLLDRFDSALIAIPVAIIYLVMIDSLFC